MNCYKNDCKYTFSKSIRTLLTGVPCIFRIIFNSVFLVKIVSIHHENFQNNTIRFSFNSFGLV